MALSPPLGALALFRGLLRGLDLELSRNSKLLEAEGITFQPAINEELAATAIWGSQHIHLYDKPEIDGVFGLWYGKGPGLDRALTQSGTLIWAGYQSRAAWY